MRILIVDDDPVLRQILQTYLARAGYEVALAEDGRAAWEIWQQQHTRLIITDWMMPVMDGPELIRHIRADSFPGYTYIIMCTAKEGKSDMIFGMEAGADDYITKPFNAGELRARISIGERILNLEGSLSLALTRMEQELMETKEAALKAKEELAAVKQATLIRTLPQLNPQALRRPLRVFLCHASDDKPTVRALYHRLKSDNLAPWLDERDILPGQNWELEITNAVRTSDAVIVCLSRSSITKSGYVQKEIRYALDRADEQPEGTTYIIPLRLEECEVPQRLRRWQWVNLFAEDGFDRLMETLQLLTQFLHEPLVRETNASDQHKPKPAISILFLAADPTDAARLRLGEEVREIQEKLRLAELRDQFELHQRMSARPADVSQALLDVQPEIVHFSGHGAPTGALCFEDQAGQIHLIQPDALAALFEQFSQQVSCVVLNACYSEAQALAIARYITYVIGMQHTIGDRAAIAFAIGFYQALGAGRSIEDAYKLGCVQIRLQNIPEHLTPVFLKKQ